MSASKTFNFEKIIGGFENKASVFAVQNGAKSNTVDSITDLTGTLWLMDNAVDVYMQNYEYDLSFTSNNTSFIKFGLVYDIGSDIGGGSGPDNQGLDYYYDELNSDRVYDSRNDTWSNNAYKIIKITGGEDATNSDLIAWLEANATQLPSTLIGTKWKYTCTNIISVGRVPSHESDYSINGTINDEAFTGITEVLFSGTGNYFYDIGYNYFSTTTPGGMANGAVGDEYIIEITDGDDAANTDLIAWFYQNATQIIEPTKELISIAVSGQKTNFTVGDTFVFGGIVTALYSDSTSEDVTASATFSGYNMLATGSQTVTATYNDKTTTYTITVSSASNGWFLKGTMNDWQPVAAYNFKLNNYGKPSEALNQYLLTVNLNVNDEIKLHLVGTDTWLGYSFIEEGGAKANFEYNSDTTNIKVLASGKYRFYLKDYGNSYQIYVELIPQPATKISGFNIIKLKDNVLTVDGTEYYLSALASGTDDGERSYKDLSIKINSIGNIVLTVGTASVEMEDYNNASNFVLADSNYLETKNGLFFCVKDSTEETYNITADITNGSSSGDLTIESGKTAEVTISASQGYALPETITVTNASYAYSSSTGIVTLSNPTGDVTITATCLEQLQAPYIEIVDAPTVGYSGNITTYQGAVNAQTYIKFDTPPASNEDYDTFVEYAGTVTGLTSYSGKTKVYVWGTNSAVTINNTVTNGGSDYSNAVEVTLTDNYDISLVYRSTGGTK